MDLFLYLLCVQVVGGKMTETGRLGAFITKVKKGSLADVVGHLRAGMNLFRRVVGKTFMGTKPWCISEVRSPAGQNMQHQ